MNPNLSGNQWRPLQPQPNEFGGGNGGNLFHQQPRPSRQITKNPQNMNVGFQNFIPNIPNGLGTNSFGSNQTNGSNNGPLSPALSNSASTGRLTSLMSPNGAAGPGNMSNFDFMGSGPNRSLDQTRLSPSFNSSSGLQQNRGANNLINMPNPLSPRDFERHSMNNGFDSARQSVGQSPNSGMANGYRNASSSNFERSISVTNGMSNNPPNSIGSFFDQFKPTSAGNNSSNQSEINSLLRHMSVPNGGQDNGLGLGRNGGLNGGNMMNQNNFMRNNSTMTNMKSPGSSNNGFGFSSTNNRPDVFNSMGGSVFNSRPETDGASMRNSSPPNFNGSGSMNEMKIGMWNEGRPSSPGKNETRSPSNGFMNGMGNNITTSGNNNFPSMGEFEIGTFVAPTQNSGNSGDTGSSMFKSSTFNADSNGSQFGGGGRNVFGQSQSGRPIAGPGIRETGIIEKLLHSYGFIQCCDRQARLFFHFSQFDGTIEHLKIGDPVEFEMTYDRRTGKPIASVVSKIAPEVVMSEERVIGVVTTEARIDPENGQATQGRISYENRGECFFLPFTLSDVEGNVTVAAGDKCSFQMATMARTGNLVARTIRLENPVAPVKYQGVVNSVKDQKTFGFIERSDVVREIFFHFTEVNEGENIDLGDDVEFTIQTRNGKEVATNIIALPPGTVVFEDVGTEYYTGQVLKPLDRTFKAISVGIDGKAPEEALNGRVKYRGVDRSEVEVPFGEKDQVGDFTMRHGDWIKFVIAVDRRDKLRRATKIELLDESFQVSDERREQGTVHSLREGFGFMRCAERDVRMFFHFSECLDVKRSISVADECEFTVSPDPNQPSRMLATRIKHLSAGTVQFDIVIHKDITGRVDIQPAATSWAPRSPTRNGNLSNLNLGNVSPDKSGTMDLETCSKEGAGKIIYELNGSTLEIPLYASDCDLRNFPRKDDVVQFDINQSKATKETNAVNIIIVESPAAKLEAAEKAAAEAAAAKEQQIKREQQQRERDQRRPATYQGYIAALKDGFGFVETLTHEKEIFFHFSNVEGKPEKLEVGMEVEYTIFNREKGGKISAEGVKVLTKGTIPPLKGTDEVLNGKVVRPLRSANPDQDDYCGLIHVKSEEGKVMAQYEFGIASLLNKKELLQVGDPVQFQVHTSEDFAVNIQATREKLRSNVEAMKGQFGFLSYEVDEGKKLFFHTSEVEGNEILQQGDEVEFVVVTNKRTGKHSACCVRKLSSSKRPERLISKLKTMNLEDAARGGKKIVVIRQPRGPEGIGFKATRNV